MLLLHLSDIHFKYPQCAGDNDPELMYRDHMSRDISDRVKELGDIDAILVTGDIAHRGQSKEYEAATTWFKEVARAAGCRNERLYVVPGNHDVDRSIIQRDVTARNAQRAILHACDEQAKEHELETQLGDKDSAAALFRPMTAYNGFAKHHDCQIYPRREFWQHLLRIDERTVLRLRVCLVKTWSSGLVARWSRTGVGDLVPDSSGDPWSPLEIVRQHVKWNAAMVVEHECEQLRCRVEWHA